MSRINNLWAPLVIGSRKSWIVWTCIRSTRREAKAQYLDGYTKEFHKNLLKRVKFVKVYVATSESKGGAA